LIKEHTIDAYQVQEKNKGGDNGFHRGGYGRGRGGGYGGGGGIQPTCFNFGETGHLALFYTKTCMLCGYCHNIYHVIEYFLELEVKWEEKMGRFNMVIDELHEEHKMKVLACFTGKCVLFIDGKKNNVDVLQEKHKLRRRSEQYAETRKLRRDSSFQNCRRGPRDGLAGGEKVDTCEYLENILSWRD